MTDVSKSLQETYAAKNICFGCGPANEHGLRIRSFQEGDDYIVRWKALPHHQAFPGTINGGIVGALFDCHSNWAAAMHLKHARGSDVPASTVTAEFHVKLRYPAPADEEIRIVAKVVECSDPRVVVEATLSGPERLSATCRGVFVAVEPGHPAYHRW